jgi:(1->4)-alpha-D-glucan 1-alpha-D-glucosylmutase
MANSASIKTAGGFRASYRVQLRKSFGFRESAAILDYLDELGVSHLYLSPLFEAREGSNHGYDAVDPTRISQERGGEAAFKALMKKLEKKGSLHGVILDIVPNHLAAHFKNPLWWDVLKNGPASKYWSFFDFRATGRGEAKVILPVLGRNRRAVISSGELKAEISKKEKLLRYGDLIFPLNPHEPLPSGKKWSVKEWERVLKGQHYVLEEWRKGSREINYRRFFDINDLAALKMEDPKVFDWFHSELKRIIEEFDAVDGLRVDHVDGLLEPKEYLQRLIRLSPNVWVEKILGDGESLPADWPVRGSTGYEFLNVSARLFVDLPGLLELHAHYIRHIDGRWARFHDCLYDSKREVLETHFPSELRFLTANLYALVEAEPKAPGFSDFELQEALTELTCSLGVYRVYLKKDDPGNSPWLEKAFAEVEGRGQLASPEALRWLREVLLEKKGYERALPIFKKWEQLTGPVMAKGLEDTALYRYFPLLSLNVVGGEPDWSGDGALEFHAFNGEKKRSHPLGMNTTTTHDTKRSEDVRSRIHVLSELSEDWIKAFHRWHKETGSRDLGAHTQYMICETLIGAWPFRKKVTPEFIDRMQAYFLKAHREAKTETSWIEPHAEFENKLRDFVAAVLGGHRPMHARFLKCFGDLIDRAAYFGALNSLSLLTLKSLSPGLPDFYQGAEIWKLTLVDPDNRRAVNYDRRKSLLKKMRSDFRRNPAAAMKLRRKNWKTGEIKMALTHLLLDVRRRKEDLFEKGEYQALEAKGPFKSCFVAFLRRHESQALLVVVPRFFAGAQKAEGELAPREARRMETLFHLPEDLPKSWVNLLDRKEAEFSSVMKAKDLFRDHPVAIYETREKP